MKKTEYFLQQNPEKIEKSELDDLLEVLKFHSHLYYNKQAPVISDAEYDDLYTKAKRTIERFSLDIEIPVGADLTHSTFEKVPHTKPMLSLDNTYSADELHDFDGRLSRVLGVPDKSVAYTIEFKYDGFSLELVYENGEFQQAITRGNGIEGEDVTENARGIVNIPMQIPEKERIEFRGEVMILNSEFANINKQRLQEGQQPFSNPRNSASGTIRMKDPSFVAKRKLHFFAYDIPNFEGEERYADLINHTKKLGFETGEFSAFAKNIDEVVEKISEFEKLRNQLDYDIDGLVIKASNLQYRKTAGRTAHHPRYAIAYKFPTQEKTTQILSIEHSIGRTGTITPVANLASIEIGGVTVQRATLHNYDELAEKQIRLYDWVFVKRAGEVIPDIIAPIPEKRTGQETKIETPTHCPYCGHILHKNAEKVRIYCPNIWECHAQIRQNLAYMVGKNAFNIAGLGEGILQKLYDAKLVQNIVDVFEIPHKKEEILSLEGFQEKSVENLVTAVHKAKNMHISTLLTGLAISWIGKKTASEIAKIFQSNTNILDFHFTQEDFLNLNEIGEELAKNIVEFFTHPRHQQTLKKLIPMLNIRYDTAQKEGVLQGKKICITGSFENYKREQLANMVEENGGEFVTSVSKNTDILLVWEKAGSKKSKAKQLEIPVWNLQNFLDFLGKNV